MWSIKSRDFLQNLHPFQLILSISVTHLVLILIGDRFSQRIGKMLPLVNSIEDWTLWKLTKMSPRYSSHSKNFSKLSRTANRLVDVGGDAAFAMDVAWSSTVIIDTLASFSISDLSMDIGDKISFMHTGVSTSCLISCSGNLMKPNQIYYQQTFKLFRFQFQSSIYKAYGHEIAQHFFGKQSVR